MKDEQEPSELIDDEQEGAGAIFWVFASIVLVIVAIICFLFSGFCR